VSLHKIMYKIFTHFFKVCLLLLVLLQMHSMALARPNLFNLDFGSFFNFPAVRRGRATAATTLPISESSNSKSSVAVSKNGGAETNALAQLIESVMKEVAGEPRSAETEEYYVPVEVVEQEPMRDFGSKLADYEALADEPVMDLNSLESERTQFLRQAETEVNNDAEVDENDDDAVRCIPKVMQVEETVYDRAIKCHHSYHEKCHMTYITDYRSTSEEKCETTFKKNCHITFKPMPFNETVRVCHNPLVRTCSDDVEGPEICNTYYETACETTYKTYEVEQDEPVCRMEIMTKCEDVKLDLPEDQAEPRQGKQEGGEDTTESNDNSVTVDQKCEEWPVQKCTLEKKLVKKVHPDTACRKVPKEVCAPNNCKMEAAEEVCKDEARVQVQNVPEEECDLQPEETCHMEAVLVPRLVPKPNCVKVPKEVCVNSKTNPRVVKKPVIKEWCYRPSELRETPEVTPPTPDDVSAFSFF